MTRAEKAGYKAYPENKGYSTIGDTIYDYNAEKRRVFIGGYEQGNKDAIDKACEYLADHINKDLVIYHDYTWLKRDEFIEAFKKAMEKQ